MFKKWVLAAFLACFALLKVSPTYAGKASWTEIFKMKAALCLYWECPAIFMRATGLSKVPEQDGRVAALQSVTRARLDAKFFASKVIFTEPGDEPDQLYKMIQIRVNPEDRLTTFIGYNETPIEISGRRIINIDNYQAHTLKINGRALISKELSVTHHALQGLMIEGVIAPPNNQYGSATNARLLNKYLLEK
jgi:hypothetical protein